jgi:replicative DNA helicase
MTAIRDLDRKAEMAIAERHRRDALPSNPELEQALLGGILRVPGAYREVAGILEPGHFFVPENAEVFAMVARRQGRGVTPEALAAEARERIGDHGPEYLRTLADSIVTLINLGSYAHTIRDLAQRRGMLDFAEDLKARARDLTVDETADQITGWANAELSEIASVAETFESAGAVAHRVVANLDKPVDADLTGLEPLDEVLAGGLHSGRFYGFGGRFKGGKSFLLSSISYNLADRGVPHVYLTLESGADQLVERFMARRMGRNARLFQSPERRGHPSTIAAADDAARWLDQTPLVVRRRPRMSIYDLKATLAQVGLSRRYRGVIVDYLQLVTGQGRGDSLTVHYENVAQVLAEAAVNYGIWVVAAAQLNSEGGVRHGEGMLLACDAAYALNVEDCDGPEAGAWLECLAHRYGPAMDVGEEAFNRLVFDKKVGPHFRGRV